MLALREEPRLRVFGSGVLRRIFGPRRKEVRGECKNYTMGSLMICILHQIFFG